MHDRFSAFINPIMSNCSFLVKVTEAVRNVCGSGQEWEYKK